MNKNKYFYNKLVRYLQNGLAILLVLWGVFAVLTPLTPGSWLFFVGLFVIFGKKKTGNLVERIIGKKLFQILGIKRLLRKLSKIK